MPLHLYYANLILIVICCTVLISDYNLALTLTIFGGILLDLLSASRDGLITASFLLVFLILHFVLNSVLNREPNRFVLFVSVAAATIGFYVFFLILNEILSFIHLSQGMDIVYYVKKQLPLALASNLVFTFPIFKFCSWIQKGTPSVQSV